MRMRLALAIAMIGAVGCGVCAVGRAEESPSPHSSAAAPAATADSAEHKQEQENAAERLNPITFRGINFRGDLAIWTAVVFLVVLAILWKYAWGPIVEGLDKRERNIADQIAQAEAANRKANEILADYDRKLATAQEQVLAILEQGRRDAERAGDELLDKAKAEAKAEHQRAMKQIDAATTAAIKELANQSATLAVDLAGKILGAKLKASDHARLIEQAVAGFAKGQNRVNHN